MPRGYVSPTGFSPLLLLAVMFALCTAVVGHGYLSVPKSRNLIAHLKEEEYCEHCLSSGGPGLISTLTPGGSWPSVETSATAVRHTMCGEAADVPASQRRYNPAPVPSISSLPVYAPGQEFDISFEVSTHHRGHFEFRLCDTAKLSDPRTVTWACLNEHVLQRVSVPGEVSPVDVNYPERYYLEPECAPGYTTTTKMRYRMPANLTCERCVMQMWWVTANSCNPPGYANRSPQPAHVATGCRWMERDLTNCGGYSYPEEFWNCADVRVVGAANPAPALGNTEAPAPASAPAPVVAPAQPRAPAPAPASQAPAAPVEQGCVNLGWQCGGSSWTGATCCNQGSCTAYIPEYSECRMDCPLGWICNQQTAPPTQPPAVPAVPPTVPVVPPAVPAVAPAAPRPAPQAPPAVPKAPPAAPKPAPKAPAPAPAPAPASQTCAGNGWQCGGDGWTGPTCCVGNTQCYAYISTYSQCRSSCPAGWLCSADKQKDFVTSAIDWVKSLA